MTPTAPTGPSLVVEALGYLGGAIMIAGAGILVGQYWADIPGPLRLVLTGATAIALIAGGVAVPERLGDAAGRLRSVVWALAVVTTASFFTTFAGEVLDRHDEQALIITGTCTALVGGVLWWRRRTWLQQLAFLLPLVMAAQGLGFTITDDLDNSRAAPSPGWWVSPGPRRPGPDVWLRGRPVWRSGGVGGDLRCARCERPAGDRHRPRHRRSARGPRPGGAQPATPATGALLILAATYVARHRIEDPQVDRGNHGHQTPASTG